MEEQRKKVTIVLFSGTLDRALAAFIIATSAAAMGMDVTIFFTFWGLNVLKRHGQQPKGKGWMRRMLNWMNRGTARQLPLSRFDFAGLGPWMMGRLMREQRMQSLPEMIVQAKSLGVKFIVCTTSCGLMGIEQGNVIPEADLFAGAATYLGEASKAQVNLFI